MGKQTMGTPGLSWVHRTDNKSYRIQTPQAPIVHNQLYRDYEFDTYPQGMNSVVAVISYTGYVAKEERGERGERREVIDWIIS